MNTKKARKIIVYGIVWLVLGYAWWQFRLWLSSGFEDGVASSMEYGESYQVYMPAMERDGLPIIAIKTDWLACDGNVRQLAMQPSYVVNGHKINFTSICVEYHKRSDIPTYPEDIEYVYEQFKNKSIVTFEIDRQKISFSTRHLQDAIDAIPQ